MRLTRAFTNTTPGAALGALAVGALAHSTAIAGIGGAASSHRADSASLVPVTASMPQATTFKGTRAVGALFNWTAGGGLGGHFCTASVVASADRDLLMTAAHCVSGRSRSGMVFVPAYHEGRVPFGIWHISQVFVDRAWSAARNPEDDFAFLVTDRSSSGARVQTVTGGERLGIGKPVVETVDVIGYPGGESSPITCTNETFQFSTGQMEFDCGGYTDGTSGGPFLTHVSRTTGLGTVIGVIGGYEQGGDTPEVSYAARLRSPASTLYDTASSSAAAAAG